MTSFVVCVVVAFIAFWLGWCCHAVLDRSALLDQEFTPHRVPENVSEPEDRA